MALTIAGTTNRPAGYFVAAASPAATPACVNDLRCPRWDVRRSAIETISRNVIATSVVPKCESRTWRNARLKNSAARSPVVSSQSRRPTANTTATVAVPSVADIARLNRKNGSQ